MQDMNDAADARGSIEKIMTKRQVSAAKIRIALWQEQHARLAEKRPEFDSVDSRDSTKDWLSCCAVSQ